MRRDAWVESFGFADDDDGRWMERGLCRGADPNLFVPIVPHRGVPADTDAARDVCRICPVREACLKFSLLHPKLQGVWGGTDDTDRRLIRRAARAALVAARAAQV